MWIIFLLGPGVLKKSSSSLQPVPEFAESKIRRADSNLETVESEVHNIFAVYYVMCSLTFTLHVTVPNQGWGGVDCPKKQQQQQQQQQNKVKTVDDRLLNYFWG